MPKTDTILIALLKNGDKKVFESIYHQYFGQLLIYAREYVINRETAKEIAQETFLKLWETKENLNHDTNLQSLLYRITRNHCLNYLKHLKVQNKYENYSKSQKTEMELNRIALGQSGAEKLISEELEEHINKTINALSPRCREIFILSRYKEKKYKEIAQDLDISVKTVENQIQKALKILRENLSDYVQLFLLLSINFF